MYRTQSCGRKRHDHHKSNLFLSQRSLNLDTSSGHNRHHKKASDKSIHHTFGRIDSPTDQCFHSAHRGTARRRVVGCRIAHSLTVAYSAVNLGTLFPGAVRAKEVTNTLAMTSCPVALMSGLWRDRNSLWCVQQWVVTNKTTS